MRLRANTGRVRPTGDRRPVALTDRGIVVVLLLAAVALVGLTLWDGGAFWYGVHV